MKAIKKLRILHIEDNEIIIKMVKDMLGRDYFYSSVNNINEAIRIILKKKVDVVLLDLRLGTGDSISSLLPGTIFLKEISEAGLKVNVVVLSALTEQSKIAKRSYPSLVKSIVNKPFIKKTLIDAITKAV